MGFTHYWYKEAELDKKSFKRFSKDVNKVIKALELIVPLADYDGSGKPEVTTERISFNGVADCGHKRRDLGITWASDNSGGISLVTKEDEKTGLESDVEGSWFAGATLNQRTCDGDCSHESFTFERVVKGKTPDKDNKVFDCCKTAYKPYDLVVMTCLLLAKKHFDDAIVIKSDGTLKQWQDAFYLIKKLFKYNLDNARQDLGGE